MSIAGYATPKFAKERGCRTLVIQPDLYYTKVGLSTFQAPLAVPSLIAVPTDVRTSVFWDVQPFHMRLAAKYLRDSASLPTEADKKGTKQILSEDIMYETLADHLADPTSSACGVLAGEDALNLPLDSNYVVKRIFGPQGRFAYSAYPSRLLLTACIEAFFRALFAETLREAEHAANNDLELLASAKQDASPSNQEQPSTDSDAMDSNQPPRPHGPGAAITASTSAATPTGAAAVAGAGMNASASTGTTNPFVQPAEELTSITAATTNIYGPNGRTLLPSLERLQMFHKRRRLNYAQYPREPGQYAVLVIVHESADARDLQLMAEVLFDRIGFGGVLFQQHGSLVSSFTGNGSLLVHSSDAFSQLVSSDPNNVFVNNWAIPLHVTGEGLMCVLGSVLARAVEKGFAGDLCNLPCILGFTRGFFKQCIGIQSYKVELTNSSLSKFKSMIFEALQTLAVPKELLSFYDASFTASYAAVASETGGSADTTATAEGFLFLRGVFHTILLRLEYLVYRLVLQGALSFTDSNSQLTMEIVYPYRTLRARAGADGGIALSNDAPVSCKASCRLGQLSNLAAELATKPSTYLLSPSDISTSLFLLDDSGAPTYQALEDSAGPLNSIIASSGLTFLDLESCRVLPFASCIVPDYMSTYLAHSIATGANGRLLRRTIDVGAHSQTLANEKALSKAEAIVGQALINDRTPLPTLPWRCSCRVASTSTTAAAQDSPVFPDHNFIVADLVDTIWASFTHLIRLMDSSETERRRINVITKVADANQGQGQAQASPRSGEPVGLSDDVARKSPAIAPEPAPKQTGQNVAGASAALGGTERALIISRALVLAKNMLITGPLASVTGIQQHITTETSRCLQKHSEIASTITNESLEFSFYAFDWFDQNFSDPFQSLTWLCGAWSIFTDAAIESFVACEEWDTFGTRAFAEKLPFYYPED